MPLFSLVLPPSVPFPLSDDALPFPLSAATEPISAFWPAAAFSLFTEEGSAAGLKFTAPRMMPSSVLPVTKPVSHARGAFQFMVHSFVEYASMWSM